MGVEQIVCDIGRIAKDQPCAVGEYLRAWAFPGEQYGCYSTFEVRRDAEEVEATPREFAFLWGRPFDPSDIAPNDWSGYCDAEAIKNIRWFRHPNEIEFGWYWDGDGTLAFMLPGIGLLTNSDCKIYYEWEFEAPHA